MNNSENSNFGSFYNSVEQSNSIEQNNQPSPEEIQKIGSMAIRAASLESENTAEQRETFLSQIISKAKENRVLSKVLGVGLAATVAFSLAACGAGNSNSNQSSFTSEDGIPAVETTAVSGEQENGVRYDYSHYADVANKESTNAYDYNFSNCYGDKDATIEGILGVAGRAPEALASYAYNIFTDEEKTELGIGNDMTMTEIDDHISNDQDGGALQYRLINKLGEVLKSDDTSYQYYYENDIEDTNYIYFIDENKDGAMTPNEMHIGYDTCKRNKAPQVDIYRKLYKDKGKAYKVKMIDLNYYCGFQPNYEEGEIPEGVPHISANQTENSNSSSESNPDQPAATEWGKSGDPHGGPDVTYSDKVDPNSEVSKEQNDSTNKGNQGYVNDNQAKPGSSSENNGTKNDDRLSGGENQGGSQTNGENAYWSSGQTVSGSAFDNSGNSAQAAAQEYGGENGGGASAGGNNYSNSGEENPENW